MKLILVRHGETEENIVGIIQGQSIHGNLSEKGINQVKIVSEKLKPVKINVILTSDLKRALDTVEIIAVFHPETKIILTKDLRERNWGEFEGKKKADLNWPELKEKYQKGSEKPENGENFYEFYNRVNEFFKKIKKDYPDKTILVVSHKNFIRTLIGIINEKPTIEIHDFGRINQDDIYEFEV